MSEVVTKLVIDADTSGADSYARAMDGAEQANKKWSDSLGGAAIGIAALGAGAIAAVAGVRSFLDFVATTNKDLADLAQNAKTAGLSLQDFQSLKFAANVGGVSDAAFNSGLQKSASLLNDAQRNANTLSKLFAENGDSIRGANGQLITENQLLSQAANYMRNAATEQDKIKIAEMLGFTKEWVPFLEQGATAIERIAKEAQAAGAVIDDDTIKRATEFDAAWRKSSVEFSAYMKSALLGLLPFIDDLIERTGKWLKSLNRTDIEKAAGEQLKGLGDQVGMSSEGGLKIGITSATQQALEDFQKAPFFSLEFWAAAGRAFSSSVQVIPQQDLKWHTGAEPVQDTSNVVDLARWQAQADALKRIQASVVASGDAISAAGRKTKIPGDDTSGAEKIETTIAMIEKHTARVIADTDAVGLGAAAQAEFRTMAALNTVAMQNGGKVTDEQAVRFRALADAAGAAALALARAKVANENNFNARTSFLTADDVAIARQLKDIYPDVADALNSAEASQMRFNTAMRGMSSTIEGQLVPGLTDIAMGTKGVAQGATEMGIAVLRAIEQMIIKILIVTPLMQALQALMQSMGFTNLGGASGPITVGGPSGPTAFTAAEGGTFGPGWGVVGEEGPELINVHGGGVTVIPHNAIPGFADGGRLDSSGNVSRLPTGQNNSPVVNVTLIETRDGGGHTTQRQNSNGGIDIEVAIAQIAATSAGRPGGALNRVLTEQLGSVQKLVRR